MANSFNFPLKIIFNFTFVGIYYLTLTDLCTKITVSGKDITETKGKNTVKYKEVS